MHSSISSLVKQYVLKLIYIKIYLEIMRKTKQKQLHISKTQHVTIHSTRHVQFYKSI